MALDVGALIIRIGFFLGGFLNRIIVYYTPNPIIILKALTLLAGISAVLSRPSSQALLGSRMLLKWDFPKIRGTFFWGPYNKDPTIQGYFS